MTNWKKVHETLTDSINDCLHRIKVPGGFIYRSMIFTGGTTSQAICFVPGIDDEIDLDKLEKMIWEGAQTHLSILRCEGALKKLEQECAELRKYISDCDKSRFDADAELHEQLVHIKGHLVL